MYVYIRSEPTLWTVGHYDPSGKWISESDHDDEEKAAERVHYLNGGDTNLLAAAREVVGFIEGRLPVRGNLRDCDDSRKALAKLLDALAKDSE
jgi:hypothetical protein